MLPAACPHSKPLLCPWVLLLQAWQCPTLFKSGFCDPPADVSSQQLVVGKALLAPLSVTPHFSHFSLLTPHFYHSSLLTPHFLTPHSPSCLLVLPHPPVSHTCVTHLQTRAPRRPVAPATKTCSMAQQGRS